MSIEIKIHEKKFKFDLNNFEDLCTNNSNSTSLIRWKLDNKNRPYHLDNNSKTIYLLDKIMKSKCNDKIVFINSNDNLDLGATLNVQIEKSSPWYLVGSIN